MKLKRVHRDSTYIPKFNGNQDLPDSEQIKITIKKWPTVTEAKAFKNFSVNASGDVSINYRDNVMIPACIGRILNLSVEDEVIKNGSDLANSTCLGLGDLITELREVILADSEDMNEGE